MYIFSEDGEKEKFRLLNELMGCGKAVQQSALAWERFIADNQPGTWASPFTSLKLSFFIRKMEH